MIFVNPDHPVRRCLASIQRIARQFRLAGLLQRRRRALLRHDLQQHWSQHQLRQVNLKVVDERGGVVGDFAWNREGHPANDATAAVARGDVPACRPNMACQGRLQVVVSRTAFQRHGGDGLQGRWNAQLPSTRSPAGGATAAEDAGAGATRSHADGSSSSIAASAGCRAHGSGPTAHGSGTSRGRRECPNSPDRDGHGYQRVCLCQERRGGRPGEGVPAREPRPGGTRVPARGDRHRADRRGPGGDASAGHPSGVSTRCGGCRGHVHGQQVSRATRSPASWKSRAFAMASQITSQLEYSQEKHPCSLPCSNCKT